jgi:hypothetical protein
MAKDRESILNLMNEYCYRIDQGDLTGFAELFAHGTWLVQGDPNGGDTGTAAVMATLQNIILYEGKPNTKHVMSNIQLEIDENGDTARAQCYITVNQAVPPDFPLQPIFIGHYHDQFEKIDNSWRFVLRDISPDLPGDLSHHRSDY